MKADLMIVLIFIFASKSAFCLSKVNFPNEHGSKEKEWFRLQMAI